MSNDVQYNVTNPPCLGSGGPKWSNSIISFDSHQLDLEKLDSSHQQLSMFVLSAIVKFESLKAPRLARSQCYRQVIHIYMYITSVLMQVQGTGLCFGRFWMLLDSTREICLVITVQK